MSLERRLADELVRKHPDRAAGALERLAPSYIFTRMATRSQARFHSRRRAFEGSRIPSRWTYAQWVGYMREGGANRATRGALQ